MNENTTELNIGDIAPDFCLPDKDNQELCLRDFRGKKHVILYFYPMDNTPGCTIEGIEFTTILPDFQKLDAIVIGISPDSPKSHAKFIERKKLKVTLLSDVEKKVLKQYGVWGKVTLRDNEFIGVIRTTFLIDPEGKIIHIWPKVNAKGHAEEVKEKLTGILEELIVDVLEAINKRRAYRSFTPIEVTDNLVHDLASVAQIAPSCINSQPWQFIFIYAKENIEKILPALPKRNQVWIKHASLIIALFSKVDNDCIINEREYYLFDMGLASAFIILRATELGLVAHPIAGFDEQKAKHILKIPENMKLITFINIGKKSDIVNPELSEPQKLGEKQRPPRKSLSKFVFINQYGDAINE